MKKKVIFPFFLIIFFFTFIHLLYAEDTRGITALVKHLDRNIEVGRQYLLLIAIDNYENFSSLTCPVADAKEIRNILMDKYCIDEVIELYNQSATRANIIKTLTSLKDTLTVADSLLIYFAGHGDLDEGSDTGSWIPVDAEEDPLTQVKWIPNHLVRGIISKMDALHILLISDSCFSGDILDIVREDENSPDPAHIPYFRNTYIRTSREVITSGASEVVPDRSEFSEQLKICLKKNPNPYLDTLTLFNSMKLGVTLTFPLMGELKATKHQKGGSFILFLKDADMTLSTGILHISIKTSGNLYINGDFSRHISAGSEILTNIDPGDYDLKVHYESGEVESHSVTVEKGKTAAVSFYLVPGEPYKAPELHTNYMTYSLGFGLPVPVFDRDLNTGIGYSPGLMAGYSIKLDWGRLIFGIASGFTIQPLKEDYEGVTMYSIQGAGSIGYRTTFLDPFYIFIEPAGGIAVNIFVYDSESGDKIETRATPFISPSLGIGWNVIPSVSISAYGSFVAIFFIDKIIIDKIISGITPGIRCEINMR